MCNILLDIKLQNSIFTSSIKYNVKGTGAKHFGLMFFFYIND